MKLRDKEVKLLIQVHTASARRQGFDSRAFTFDYETYGLWSSELGNRILTVKTDLTPRWYETPVDIKIPSIVFFQGKRGFQFGGENEQRRHPGEQMVLVSGSPQTSCACLSLWMRYIPSESHVPFCVEVCLWSSQPPWRAGAPLGCSWWSGDDCPAPVA